MRYAVLILILALTSCQSIGAWVSDNTGLTPRQRYAQWGDYYGTLADQPAEDIEAIRQAQVILRGQ